MMRIGRVVLALLLGVATTVLFAWGAPAAMLAAMNLPWRSAALPVAPPFSIVTKETRPFVDRYEVDPGSYADYLRSSGTPIPLPSVVGTIGDRNEVDVIETRLAGWPLRAMAYEARFPYPAPTPIPSARKSSPPTLAWGLPMGEIAREQVVLPLRPVPVGFAADTVIFAAAWLAVLTLPAARPRWWREGKRLRRGRCPGCGYDLAWDFKAGCGECGWRKGATSDRRSVVGRADSSTG